MLDTLRKRAGKLPLTEFVIAFFAPEIRAWYGAAPLWKVFWGYGVLASSILAIVYILALYENRLATQQALLLAFACYTVWILVSVWRCAGNCKNPSWGFLARLATVAWAGNATMFSIFLQLGLVKKYLGL